MRNDDAQLGKPGIVYKNTKANIEALTGVVEGAVAYATDTNLFGAYDGAAWKWLEIGYPADGRLTLETGVPVSTSDQSAKTTLYYTQYLGDRLALYDGTKWDILTFTEPSISLAGLTASRPYDVFAYNNSGAVALELLAWTNTTTRATALVRQNGVLVKSGAPTRRYLGTIYINSSGGQTDDSATKRFVWNYHRLARVERRVYCGENTNHTYNGAMRKWNNSDSNNLLEWVVGVAEVTESFAVRAYLTAGADNSIAAITPYIDGSEVNALYRVQNANAYRIAVGVGYFDASGIGYHNTQVYETGDHNDSRFINMMLTGVVIA